jgi:hypothetical protein
VDPNDYDVLITDMNNDTLYSKVSKLMDIPYLKEATRDEADKVVIPSAVNAVFWRPAIIKLILS